MPLYQYSCECGESKDVVRSFSDKSPVECPQCREEMSRDFTPSAIGHVRGSTPSKAFKESRVRKKRNAELGVKQIERWGSGSKLHPNIDGQEVDSWETAAKIAAERGKDTTKFKELAEAEKHSQNSRGIDERKWKQAKEELRKS
jgi:putative FmdB family regulatory protein